MPSHSPSTLCLISQETLTYRSTSLQPQVADLSLCHFLYEQATASNSSQSRICFHQSDDVLFHSMLVYHSLSHQVPWHKHPIKSESIHLIDGSFTLHFRDSDLQPHSLKLSASPSDQHPAMIFIPSNTPHRLELHTDIFFIESTQGPFDQTSTQMIN